MAIWKVKTDSLNLRSTPDKQPGNIIKVLPLAQEVNVISGAPTDRWWNVETVLGGTQLTGFVSAAFLRQPVSAAKETLISIAVAEWLRFKQGNAEYEDPFYKYVGTYWQSIGLDLDGRDRDQTWSAAFISFVVQKAGYANFESSAAHHTYIRDAIEKREANKTAP